VSVLDFSGIFQAIRFFFIFILCDFYSFELFLFSNNGFFSISFFNNYFSSIHSFYVQVREVLAKVEIPEVNYVAHRSS